MVLFLKGKHTKPCLSVYCIYVLSYLFLTLFSHLGPSYLITLGVLTVFMLEICCSRFFFFPFLLLYLKYHEHKQHCKNHHDFGLAYSWPLFTLFSLQVILAIPFLPILCTWVIDFFDGKFDWCSLGLISELFEFCLSVFSALYCRNSIPLKYYRRQRED